MSLGITPFVAAVLLAAASMVSAQDSHFSPDHQQIHTPGCLIMREAWEGGSKPCTPMSMTLGWPTFDTGVMNAVFA